MKKMYSMNSFLFLQANEKNLPKFRKNNSLISLKIFKKQLKIKIINSLKCNWGRMPHSGMERKGCEI